ncbi:MAG: hypothetical protein ACRENS_01345 [Candidatus Eiseniibacteriota bacterium]
MWLLPASAHAVLDINDRGPVLDQGTFRLRVTNAGILGNAFYNVGLSNDPSFEFPANSGTECLNHADLWVGAIDDLGHPHVSGGPTLEWRPTLDPSDHVRMVRAGDAGTQRLGDDDGDGRTDEEVLNGRDDDGDGYADEDLGMIGDVMAASDYVDDRPEAINWTYSNGETHHPLGLSVHEEDYAWAHAGFNHIAGIHYVITNHGSSTLHQVQVGLLADLDSRSRLDSGGHLNDLVVSQIWSQTFNNGVSSTSIVGTPYSRQCVSTVRDNVPVLIDGIAGSGLPAVAVLGLGHTTDPAANYAPLQAYARAPGQVGFRYTVLTNSRPQEVGGIPRDDASRYSALSGAEISAESDAADDYLVLISCGPFASLGPGQSVTFDVALVAAQNLDSLRVAAEGALYLYHGSMLNLLADSTGAGARDFSVGRSGLNGHEVCLEPPVGVTFLGPTDCPGQFGLENAPSPTLVQFQHGTCVWTDADCDICTGFNGNDTQEPWSDPGSMPPPPALHVQPGDHRVTIGWDNQPEILIKAGLVGTPRSSFVGYRLYRLGDWRGRQSMLPPLENWALVHAYAIGGNEGEVQLPSVTDSTLDYDRIEYQQKHYPIGRYHDVDSTAKDGFDYYYLVTTVMDFAYVDRFGANVTRRIEGPITARFEQRITPAAASRPTSGLVWVVPNPFRAQAGWDRPVVPGDPLTRHIDFMGLPQARSTIRIYTVAGDFVAQLDHDGSGGDGEAAWNLISRNGQDVMSGIYMFTVDSSLGHQMGHFVVIR